MKTVYEFACENDDECVNHQKKKTKCNDCDGNGENGKNWFYNGV